MVKWKNKSWPFIFKTIPSIISGHKGENIKNKKGLIWPVSHRQPSIQVTSGGPLRELRVTLVCKLGWLSIFRNREQNNAVTCPQSFCCERRPALNTPLQFAPESQSQFSTTDKANIHIFKLDLKHFTDSGEVKSLFTTSEPPCVRARVSVAGAN